ncbi:MAG: hypothetical protein WEA99_13800 [Brumimicrobium sp.]
MIYLLIDTSTLKKDLVKKIEYSPFLRQILYWVEIGEVTILLPDVLAEEWEKHKEIEKEALDRALNNIVNEKKKNELIELEFDLEEAQTKAQGKLWKQIEDIDRLFYSDTSTSKFELNQSTSHKVIQFRRNGKAPFHKKKDSINDACLILSSIDFLNEKEIRELYFVSFNFNDFGDPISKKDKIHNDIAEYNPNVQINYYSEINKLIEGLKKKGLHEFKPKELTPTVRTEKIKNKNTNKNPLLVLDDLNKNTFAELNFIPIHILLQYYPFSLTGSSSYKTFTLYSDNTNLESLFKSFSIGKNYKVKIEDHDFFKDIKEPVKKISDLLKALTSNLIYTVQINDINQYIDTRFSDKTVCPCPRCQIEKFEFRDLDFDRNVKDTTVENLMNRAYAHYKVGHFKKAYSLYKDVIKQSEDKSLFRYLAKYNLNHLATLIENYNYGDQESIKISKELRSIDLSNSICETTSEFNREIIDQMHNDFYIEQFYSRISELKKKIVDHYFSSISGEMSSNNYVRELANVFLQFDRFLQQNTIISDCYKPYFDISDIYIEGLLASYATHGKNNSKLIHFIDWILIHMLKKGKVLTIRKFMSRYNIKTLKYKSSDEQNSVKKYILRLIEQYSEAFEKVRTVEEQNHRYFESKYNTWVENALYLTGVVEFDKAFVKEFASVFIKNLTSHKLNISSYEINSFLINKYHVLTKSQLKEFLLLGVENEDLFRSLLNSFTFISAKERLYFHLSQNEYDKVIAISDSYSLIQVYQCISVAKQKKDIKKRIIDVLTNQFNTSLWIEAVKCDIVKFEDPFLELVIEDLKPLDYSNMVGVPSRPSNQENYDPSLDRFIDVCYKLKIDLAKTKFDALKNHSEYYKWLLDLDGFDYSKFEPSWLTAYGTKHYYDRFAKSDVLKEHLKKLLTDPKTEDKQVLKEAYVNIYVSKN